MRTKSKYLAFITAILFYSVTVASEFQDTLVHNLEEIIIEGTANISVIPAQSLTGAQLEQLNSNSVADALRYFSGVQVKDYGGVGGIKTVNIRSMGTNHTGVVYDGVELGNAQNGQIDLGQFSLDNIETISLYNGQKSEILQPAKDFGSAGTIYLQTRTPSFKGKERFHGKITLRTGSFGLINPAAVGEYKITDKLNASLSMDWLGANGKYKFRYRRVNPSGEVAYDTTAVRQNGDINAFRIEFNLNGKTTSGTWKAKAYHYNSERGIPGAIVNNVWRRGERIWDSNSFFQGNYYNFINKFQTLANFKYAFYNTHYVNSDDRQIRIDNRYKQHEIYFSTANMYELTNWLQLSASYDFLWNELNADLKEFIPTQRYSNFVSFATSLNMPQIKAQASLQGAFITDTYMKKKDNRYSNSLSPAIYLSYQPLKKQQIYIRAFYKNSFRMPTFNDLYYTEMGNSELKPEKATQYNLGLLYVLPRTKLIKAFNVTIDTYYNRITDKIIAYPKGQQFRWTMLNLGKVHIYGTEFSTSLTINPISEFYVSLRGQYTFQRAIDVTSPTDSYYRHQIPYIPRHSGSAIINLEWKNWVLNYSWIYVGERYNQQENTIYNYTQPWYTSDVSISKDWAIKKFKLRALLEINNLFSQDYDVIINYPMPKRNYRLTLALSI